MAVIPEQILYIIKTLEEFGHQAYLAGGCVRDILLNKEPQDYDVTTSASTQEICSCFEKTIPLGESHGTVLVITDGFKVEVTTYRNRRPGSSAETALISDLAGRDFSINAMAMDVCGRIYDPWGGREDLEQGLLRATKNQADERFSEDPLRMMRAVRLCTVFDLTIDPPTYASILHLNQLLEKVSKERIREELNYILISEKPARGIRMLQKCGLMPFIMPEIERMAGLDQRNKRHHLDLFEHSLAVLEGVPAHLKVRLAALLHDVGKPACFTIDEQGTGHFYNHHVEGINIARDILARLKYDRRTIDDVALLVGAHMSRYAGLNKTSLKKLVAKLGRHNLNDLYYLQRADILGSAPPYDFTGLEEMEKQIQQIIWTEEPLEIKDLKINGDDLIAMGYSPGSELGQALQRLLKLVLENPAANKHEILVSEARQWLPGQD